MTQIHRHIITIILCKHSFLCLNFVFFDSYEHNENLTILDFWYYKLHNLRYKDLFFILCGGSHF